jgi:hypothetical protein
MPIFTKVIANVATLLAIPIFGTAIISASYFSPFLQHLTDVIHGNQTSTVVSNNAPNWSIGTPLTMAVISTVATSSYTSAASGLASSTRFSFEVAAYDANGTTTLSTASAFTTDASNTQNAPEVLNVSWTPVPGATGYAIYFSSTTPDNFSQYFYATTTSTYYFATSSGAIVGSYTNTDTTAFSTLINPGGTSYINGGNGNATTSVASSTALEVNGSVRAQSNGTTTSCYSATKGQIFFNIQNGKEWGCNGSAWVAIF